MTAKIVVVGSFNADLVTYMDRLPRPGETVHGERFVTGAGGKGSNQAVAAAHLGADVTFVGRIGQDVFAQMALDMWRQAKIDTTYVLQDPDHATGVAPIFVDGAGENVIVVALGANLALNERDIDAAEAAIAQADVLIVQLEIRREISAYALSVAQRHNVRTILNPAPAVELPPEMIANADFITPNETELQTLTGSSDEVEAAARSLLTRDDQTVIVTMGKQGAYWVSKTSSALISTYSVEAVDTTGAGDAFNGGLAVALAEGQDLDTAIQFANATAALCVTRPGTSQSMPSRDEVETLLAT